jgi:hypothetical protein
MRPEDAVLLTALSSLALLALLVALALALYRIQRSLDHVNVHAARILWGVRAIERETDPLRDGLPQLRATLTDVVAGAGAIAGHLGSADQRLGRAAEVLVVPPKKD